MDEIMRILNEPARVLHLLWLLLVFWAFLMIGLYQLQARLIKEFNKLAEVVSFCTQSVMEAA
jgi:hypothetical protein